MSTNIATSSDIILDISKEVVLASNNIKITLPSAENIDGKVLTIKNIGDGIITIVPNDKNQVIDENSEYQLTSKQLIKIIASGSKWYIIGH
jgi:hypothetical protein